MAYDYCYESEYYYTLAETLFSSAYRKELLDFIGDK